MRSVVGESPPQKYCKEEFEEEAGIDYLQRAALELGNELGAKASSVWRRSAAKVMMSCYSISFNLQAGRGGQSRSDIVEECHRQVLILLYATKILPRLLAAAASQPGGSTPGGSGSALDKELVWAWQSQQAVCARVRFLFAPRKDSDKTGMHLGRTLRAETRCFCELVCARGKLGEEVRALVGRAGFLLAPAAAGTSGLAGGALEGVAAPVSLGHEAVPVESPEQRARREIADAWNTHASSSLSPSSDGDPVFSPERSERLLRVRAATLDQARHFQQTLGEESRLALLEWDSAVAALRRSDGEGTSSRGEGGGTGAEEAALRDNAKRHCSRGGGNAGGGGGDGAQEASGQLAARPLSAATPRSELLRRAALARRGVADAFAEMANSVPSVFLPVISSEVVSHLTAAAAGGAQGEAAAGGDDAVDRL